MLCLGCNLHEKTPAPQARHGCRLSLRRGRACGFNPPAFMRRHMAAGDFMGSDTFYKAGDSIGSDIFCGAKPFCTGRESRDFFRQKSE